MQADGRSLVASFVFDRPKLIVQAIAGGKNVSEASEQINHLASQSRCILRVQFVENAL